MKRLLFLLCLTGVPLSAQSQDTLTIWLPDVQIFADRVVQGDADLYGLGDWLCRFRISIEDSMLVLDGDIVFREKANDYTIIEGAIQQRIAVPELAGHTGCRVSLWPESGKVSGPNIGARGYQWFKGSGLIQKVFFRTDTSGLDVGQVGGRVQFRPVKIATQCYFMAGL